MCYNSEISTITASYDVNQRKNKLQEALPTLIEHQKHKQTVTPITDLPKENFYYQYENKDFQCDKGIRSALFILAGGAATRLGAECPKGLYKIDLKPYQCILESLFNQMLSQCGLQSVVTYNDNNNGDSNNKKAGKPVPIILMLSEATRDTMKELEKVNFYGYPKQYILSAEQDTYNVFDVNGNPLYKNETEYLMSPNGNGGFLQVFGKLYDQHKEMFEDIQYIHCVSVDNPFIKCCDQKMINFAYKNNLQVVNRVLEVSESKNKGIMGQKYMTVQDQVPLVPQSQQHLIQQALQVPCMSVFEYSEIPELQRGQMDKAYANIANHLFSVQFLVKLWELRKELKTSITPYHLAFKKVSYYDRNTKQSVQPQQPNAYKIEHFIFDVFSFCPIKDFGVFICNEDEFLPLKCKEDQEVIEKMWRQIHCKE